MKKPKYNIGDKVWMITRNKVMEYFIVRIDSWSFNVRHEVKKYGKNSYDKEEGKKYMLQLPSETGEVPVANYEGLFEENIDESEIFPSKEELINSL